jgi:hypothetical protein
VAVIVNAAWSAISLTTAKGVAFAVAGAERLVGNGDAARVRVAGSSVAGTELLVGNGDAVKVGAAGWSVAGTELSVGNGEAAKIGAAGSLVAGGPAQERISTIAPRANNQNRRIRTTY